MAPTSPRHSPSKGDRRCIPRPLKAPFEHPRKNDLWHLHGNSWIIARPKHPWRRPTAHPCHKKLARPVKSETPHQFLVKNYDLHIAYKSRIHELGMESSWTRGCSTCSIPTHMSSDPVLVLFLLTRQISKLKLIAKERVS